VLLALMLLALMLVGKDLTWGQKKEQEKAVERSLWWLPGDPCILIRYLAFLKGRRLECPHSAFTFKTRRHAGLG
jgi:hypothetical protein